MGSLVTEALITPTFNVTKTDSLCKERSVAYLCCYYNVNVLEYSMFNLPWNGIYSLFILTTFPTRIIYL